MGALAMRPTDPLASLRPRRTATFATEAHNGAVWLVARYENGTDMLARFSTEADAADFNAILNAQLMAAHTAGALGL